MSIYDERPWLDRYPAGQPGEITPAPGDALSMFRATARRIPDLDAIRYFDGRLTFAELDRLSDAFALALLDAGIARGDRVALYLQNVPQYVLGLLGIWKVGAVAVSINPMYRERELAHLLNDSGARALLCLEQLFRDVAGEVVPATRVETVFSTSELEFQTLDDPRLLTASASDAPAGTIPLATALERFEGRTPPDVELAAEEVAILTYTSGTTGPPKGAMNTHGNVVFGSDVYRVWCDLGDGDRILGIAPLFHITGLVAHVGASFSSGAPLVLMYRFDPAVVLEAARREGTTFTVGAITAFIALMNAPGAERADLATMTKIWSGGAPIAAATLADFDAKFGQPIHNVYGMTETTSPAIAVPRGAHAPADQTSGASSVGVPVVNTVARIVDDEGAELPPGQIGELVMSGPQIVPGYWEQPEETRQAITDGGLHSGDVAYMDDDGWFYIVDRKKDQINAGGYKIWPREVEDVIFEHPAVREAAVVGVPDGYRGETVKAVVSLRPGAALEEDELIAFCKERLAAYKYPRQVEFIDDLPKTASGKILRRELR